MLQPWAIRTAFTRISRPHTRAMFRPPEGVERRCMWASVEAWICTATVHEYLIQVMIV